MKIKVSVIIPIYNREKYLEKCIDSIMNQSLKEIEIICVNDGSTDSSKNILEKLQKIDKRITIINKENGGASSARNKGLLISKGEYILFVDGDDWLELDTLEKCFNKIKTENLDMIVFGFQDNNFENVIGDISYDLVGVNERRILSGREYFNYYLRGYASQSSCNKIIKREILIKNKIFFLEGIFQNEDAYFLAKLVIYLKKVGKIDQNFYHYRVGENNGSRKVNKSNLEDMQKVFDLIKDSYSKDSSILDFILIKEIINMSGVIFNRDYHFIEGFEKFENRFFKILKKSLIFSQNEVDISRKLKISLYILKILPFHSIVVIFAIYLKFIKGIKE